MANRFFDAQRKDQGFQSQAHLDAFYRYMDHCESCAECQKPAPGIWIDDSYQPAQARCAVARQIGRQLHEQFPYKPCESLYCEFCGAGPTCIVCRRGLPA